MPRAPQKTKPRHDPLHVQLQEDTDSLSFGRSNKSKKIKKSGHLIENAEEVFDAKTSKKIFELAKDQQDELDYELVDEEDSPVAVAEMDFRKPVNDSDTDEDDVDVNFDDGVESNMFDIDSGDMQTLDRLLPPDAVHRKTLADIIFAKLDSGVVTSVTKIEKAQQFASSERPDPAAGLDPKVVEAYTKLGLYLKKYVSGPLPKMFKVIPTLPAWARILALTHPEDWSPHACYAATRIFISTMKPAQAQLFLQVVLLDSMRADIQQNHKLNVQYYESLKRALYKPAAFFKGIVFPLLDDGCTLKEATIIASVLARKTIPVLHASAALLRIAEMEYSGANSLFIRVLIDKKMQLPYKVVDGLVFHFIRISNTYKARNRGDSEKLPVLWHQSLLVFCQRYASDLTPDQKDALLDVVRATPHVQISPEIRRELISASVRGAPRDNEVVGDVDMA